MFDLYQKQCTLMNINGRHEKHGEENVLAADLKFRGDFDGDILAEFAPALRHSFYEKNDVGDLVDQGSDTPTKLRFPRMQQPVKWDAEIVGAAVEFAFGLTALKFETCDVNDFRIEMMEGGTVQVTFRVQVRPTEEQMAKCYMLLDTLVPVTIEGPVA